MWTPVTGLEEEVPTPETRLAITPPASTPPVGLPCLSALTSSGSPDPVTPAPASWETVRDHAHLDTAFRDNELVGIPRTHHIPQNIYIILFLGLFMESPS